MCKGFGSAVSKGMKTCMTATDHGIVRMDKLGGAMESMGRGIGGLATGVGVAGVVYNDFNKQKMDPSAYLLI